MIRYTRQRTMSDCGPVAVLNILKWAGFKVTYKKNIAKLKKACKYVYTHDVYTDDFIGVKWWNLRRALTKVGRGRLKTRTYVVTDLEVLKKHIEKGGAFILRHAVGPDDAHYTTVVPAENGKFAWINIGPKDTVVTLTPEEFEKRVMKTQRFNDQVIAFLVQKI